MKKCLPTLLASMIWTALYSQSAMANLAAQCQLGIPTFDQPLVNGEPNQLPVSIKSNDSTADYPRTATFSGDVIIRQGNSTLKANKVELEQENKLGQTDPVRTVTATGDVWYKDPQILLKGPKAWSNINTNDTDVYNGTYQMVGRQGRGEADVMKVRDNNRYTILDNGSFTSCLPGNDSWNVVGSQVIYDRTEQVAEIWNARFKIAGVPVFYSPYMQLPVGDKRRSGFLIPNAKYSTGNGFEFMAPYYWNIAPNYDATITPHYMSERGLQLQNEFRYLTVAGAGLVEFDFMGNDKKYEADHPDVTDSKRWLFYWNHNGVIDQVWRVNVDYTKVSDPYYFSDLESKYGSSTDGYATQKFSLGYANQNWSSTLTTKQFQIFNGINGSDAYRAEPQWDVHYYKNDLGPFDLQVFGQMARFVNVNPDKPTATRWHAEPTINLPLTNRWGSINTEAKLMATHYQQEIPQGFNAANDTQLENSVNRVLPQFKVDGKMVLERNMDWSQGYTQTLEPRVQYLYRPFRDQDNIYIYDSTLLQGDYAGLFRDRSYSGLDRVASANQVSTGLTTRIYDDALTERFNASVGQIYYFEPQRTGNNNTLLTQTDKTGSVSWAGDTFWKINQKVGFRGGLQYDPRISSLSLADAVLEYRQDADRMIQLNYRYASEQYIKSMLPDITNPLYQQGISQVGVVASWPIADRWALVGANYYDTRQKQAVDQRIGVQYNTCCWAINVGYERKIVSWNSNAERSNYDNKIGFNIQLRGLSNDHNLGISEMLGNGILPYQRAF